VRAPHPAPNPARVRKGGQARRAGRAAEAVAAAWLMLKGWRIIGFRLDVGGVEIDILARRGDVLAVVEVKRRGDIDSALAAVGPVQQARLFRAAESLAARRRDLCGLCVRLDMVTLAPGRLPRHIPDAWSRGL